MAQFCPFYRSLICNTYSMPCKCDASRLFHTYMLLMHATRCFSALAHVHALQAYCATVLILATSMHASYAFQLWCFSALAHIHARSACYSTVMLLGTWKHVGNGAVKIAQTTKTTWQRKQDKVWPRKTKKGEAAVGESNFEFSYMWSLQHLEHKTWTFHPLFPTRFWVYNISLLISDPPRRPCHGPPWYRTAARHLWTRQRSPQSLSWFGETRSCT